MDRAPISPPEDPSFWDRVGDVISQIPDVTQTWLPVFFLLLMIVIVWLLWRTMQLMPTATANVAFCKACLARNRCQRRSN